MNESLTDAIIKHTESFLTKVNKTMPIKEIFFPEGDIFDTVLNGDEDFNKTHALEIAQLFGEDKNLQIGSLKLAQENAHDPKYKYRKIGKLHLTVKDCLAEDYQVPFKNFNEILPNIAELPKLFKELFAKNDKDIDVVTYVDNNFYNNNAVELYKELMIYFYLQPLISGVDVDCLVINQIEELLASQDKPKTK